MNNKRKKPFVQFVNRCKQDVMSSFQLYLMFVEDNDAQTLLKELEEMIYRDYNNLKEK